MDLLSSVEQMHNQVALQAAVLIKQREQQALEQIKQVLTRKKKKPKRSKLLSLTKADSLQIAAQVNQEVWQTLLVNAASLSYLPAVWQERLTIWQQLEEVFAELGLITGLGFDLSKGVFQSHGWLDMVRLNKIIKKLPKLQNLIQDLGRDEAADGTLLQEIVTKMRIASRSEKHVTTPLVAMETTGVSRSDSISGMLPQEASLLTHPTLKRLWHAKRAEHGLLSY